MDMRTGLRAVVVSAAAVLGLGTVGAVSASAMPLPDGSGGAGDSWYHPGTVTSRVDGLRVRSGPGTSHPARGMLYRGQEVVILTTATVGGQTWNQVQVTSDAAGWLPHGTQGWVSDAYVVRNY
ncbi:SH3 domain-containing protein [Streptomyces sp. NPDC007063]|uniref:SH3 domain-containing protein n=2 Tax=unclassified Streptomyces TaxID=2593676 RepID=UPI003675C98B